jgi:hypothetical protein
MTFLGNVVLAPFEPVPPWLTLTIFSAIGGVIGLKLWGWTSNQEALKAVSNRTRADLLAMKLFKDELSVTFSCQWDLAKVLVKRLWLSLRPIVIMMVPFVLALAQLGSRFEHRPLRAGENAVVTLELTEDSWAKNKNAQLLVPEGVQIETPPLRVATEHTIQWRVQATQPGQHELAWEIDGRRVTKSLPVGTGLVEASAIRPGPGWGDFWDQLLYPAESVLPSGGPVAKIEIDLPHRSTPIFGFDTHWLITFLVLSVVLGLLFKPVLKVQL